MNVRNKYPRLLVELRQSHMLPSEIGLFAVRRLKKGEILAAARRFDENRFISKMEFKTLDGPTKKAILKFCPGAAEGYYAPEDLNFIHPLWYCNHCCNPNVGYDDYGNLRTLRPVCVGEELCFDYTTCSGDPQFRFVCQCGTKHCRGVAHWKREPEKWNM